MPTDRSAVLQTIRAADLLPDEGVLEVAAGLDATLAGQPGSGRWLVDVADEDVTGVAYYVPERMADGAWNLLMLAVRPDRQGRGRGRALVEAVEQDLRESDARLLIIETSGTSDFAAQRRFYKRLGYRQQGLIEDFFEPGDAKVIFVVRGCFPEAAPAVLRRCDGMINSRRAKMSRWTLVRTRR